MKALVEKPSFLHHQASQGFLSYISLIKSTDDPSFSEQVLKALTGTLGFRYAVPVFSSVICGTILRIRGPLQPSLASPTSSKMLASLQVKLFLFEFDGCLEAV